MTYSDVLTRGLILMKKEKYTKRDLDSLVVNSLFSSLLGRTLSVSEAKFIIRCSAIYHDTTYSATLKSNQLDNYL